MLLSLSLAFNNAKSSFTYSSEAFFFDAFKIAVNPELTVFVRDIFLVSGNFGYYDFKGFYITFAELQDAAVFIADSDIDGSGDLLKVKMSQQFVDEFRCCRSAGAFARSLRRR